MKELTKEQIEFFNTIGNVWENGLRDQLKIPTDYRYISERLNFDDYEKFVNVIGEDNLIFVSGGETKHTNEKEELFHMMRFSMFVSPTGIENVLKNKDQLTK